MSANDVVYADLTEFDQVQTEIVVFETNAVYRNNSSDYAVYYRKRCFAALWDNKIALVRFAPDEPLRTISRNHLIID